MTSLAASEVRARSRPRRNPRIGNDMATPTKGMFGEKVEWTFAPWRNILIVGLTAGALRYSMGTSSSEGGDGISIDGIFFPPDLKMGGVLQQLTGGGTRTKYNVAKVYAVALYVDSRGAAGSLKKFAGSAKQPALYDALATGLFAKTLFLQFHRAVSAQAVAEALAESLAKRVPAATVDKFRVALLKICGEEVAKGAKLYFMCKGEALSMGGGTPDAQATLKEKGTCNAFFDIYLGKAPISAAAKEGIGVGFAQRLYLAS